LISKDTVRVAIVPLVNRDQRKEIRVQWSVSRHFAASYLLGRGFMY
jgi:hypothetical protein